MGGDADIDDKFYDHYDDIAIDGIVIYEPASNEPFDFTGGSISGIITDSLTSQPISGASILTNIGVELITNESGEYIIENISPGDYTLTVTVPLYHSSTIQNVAVSAGETTDLNISLDPKTTGSIFGQVLNAEGLAPISSVTVQISNGTDSFTVNSDANGNFTFGDITYGDYTIDLISDSYRGIPYSVTVNVDEITQVSLVGIPQSIVDDITNGWYSQAELDQAVTDAEAAKNAIIAEKNQTITDLNSNIASMFSQEQMDQAVLNERQRWDVNGDNKISLEEAIHALQVVSGIRTQ